MHYNKSRGDGSEYSCLDQSYKDEFSQMCSVFSQPQDN